MAHSSVSPPQGSSPANTPLRRLAATLITKISMLMAMITAPMLASRLRSPQPVAQHPAGNLGEPVVERAEQRKHRSADQHIMEVRYHEEGVVHLLIERH